MCIRDSPITNAATIPSGPFSPTATITTDAKIKVISVIPETGFVPTMAIALAATVVNRKAIPATSKLATTVCRILPVSYTHLGTSRCIGVLCVERREGTRQETDHLLLELITRYVAIVVFNACLLYTSRCV